jgi:hypothetical protein
MANQIWEPQEKQPSWHWLADIANRVVRESNLIHRKQNDAGISYAGRHDFEEAFEIPVKLMIAEAEWAILDGYANSKQNPHAEMAVLMKFAALQKKSEINRLRFEYARQDRPDDRPR